MMRWRKGTTDHDSDGKMGGSNPRSVKMTNKTPKKPNTPKKAPADQDDGGAAARMATMEEASDPKAVGQVGTTSGD